MDVKRFLLKSDDGSKPETVEELLSKPDDIKMIKEDADNYYLLKNYSDPYDHLMWVISKKTGDVGWMDTIDFLAMGIDDQATIVDPPYNSIKIG